MKKILNLLSGHTSYDQIRIIQPLLKIRDKLKELNITVHLLPMQSMSDDILQQIDVTCIHGCPSLAIYPLLRRHKFCLFVDDLMTNLPKSNPANVSPQENAGLLWCHEHAKSIVCSSPYLAKTFKRFNVFVAPNLLEITHIKNDSKNVLYSFGNSHTEDLELLDIKKHNTYFFGNTLPIKYCDYKRNKLGNIELWSNQSNIFHVPLQMDYERYQIWMRNLSFGVGLCPLVDNEFNKAKSILKVGEYLQQGAISVVSPVGAYDDLPDEACVKCVDDWDSAIDLAFQNHNQIYENAYKWWRENYSYQTQEKWIEVYRKL
jgi:hypothetical protein